MSDKELFQSVDPRDGRVRETFAATEPAEVERRLEVAAEGARSIGSLSIAERAELLLRVAEALEARKRPLGRLMTEEMGKPIAAAVAEAEKCAWACRFYAEHAAAFLADEPVDTDATRSFVRYEALGPILAIMPWNFPFWQFFRFGAPALMAGNVALLKHAPNVPRCALAIEALVAEAGYPAGGCQNLFVETDRVPDLLGDPRVAAVTLTGSVQAGRAVASEAGRRIKKTVLELGGSDAFIVMPSADLGRAAETAVAARTINNGQSCIAAKRIIVAEEIADAFEARFVAGMEALAVGDPFDEAVDVGPLAKASIRDELDRQVRESVEAGARALIGGHVPDGPGFYYPPTVLVGVPPDAPACREELFGPVASLFRVASVDEAIELANDTDYGLGAAAWTGDSAERERFVRELRAGSVFVNGMVASDPRLPFGGVKDSGYGRELGEAGIREFVNRKTVWIG